MSSTRKPVQWGVLIGETVRALPTARNVTDATLFASKLKPVRGAKTAVVYRDSKDEMWRRWIDEAPVPTQLAFDVFDQEAS
ncbi:hypothetical protein [Nocardia sp. CA-119907]|uniref:hypothetical protein n=1 Tax=Nocardia sp. CA-119907 TaxID=3239973 RepID=UPI003D99ACCB